MPDWKAQIDDTTDDFLNSFSQLTLKQLNWKPNSETWSITQNLEHSMLINSSYFPILDSIRKGTYKKPIISRLGFIVSFFGRFILKAVQPDRRSKMKTSDMWKPLESINPQGIMDRFIEHQSELKRVIEDSEDLMKNGGCDLVSS